MSASSQWAAAREVQANVAGIREFTDCEYSEDAGEFETTNLASPVNANGLLCAEFGNDVITTKFKGNVVVDKLAQKTLSAGVKIDGVTWTDPGGDTHTGSLRIKGRNKKGMAKGGYVWAFEGTFTGLVTGQ